jgi:hypothetical protein
MSPFDSRINQGSSVSVQEVRTDQEKFDPGVVARWSGLALPNGATIWSGRPGCPQLSPNRGDAGLAVAPPVATQSGHTRPTPCDHSCSSLAFPNNVSCWEFLPSDEPVCPHVPCSGLVKEILGKQAGAVGRRPPVSLSGAASTRGDTLGPVGRTEREVAEEGGRDADVRSGSWLMTSRRATTCCSSTEE